MCPRCRSLAWGTVAASGRGEVYSFVLTRPGTPGSDDPLIAVLVELEEGIRLVSNLRDVEAVRQVRGTSCNQVDDVEHVLVTAGTGVPSSGLILRRPR